jgi:hypothetical protein
MKKNLRIAALVAAFALASVFAAQHIAPVEAQVGGSYGRVGNYAVGNFVGVYNVVDSILYDGEVVMADTATTAAGGLTRIAVKHYDGTSLGKMRVVGVVAGNIAKSSQRGSGRVLTWGYHPKMYVDASNVAVNQPIKLGPTVACFTKIDTTGAACGYVISRSSASTSTVNTGPRYQYKGYFWGPKWTGATL